MKRKGIQLAAFLLLAQLGACSSAARGPYSPQAKIDRDTHKAEQLNRSAAEMIATDPDKAESLLRDALAADLYFGPAHNNLGVVYLNQGRLYEASGEFEWARRVMPDHAEPRTNLAIALERAGRFDDAIASYESALAVNPNHVRSMQGLAMLQIRHGRVDEHTGDLLAELALRGETAEWREWARQQATLRPP